MKQIFYIFAIGFLFTACNQSGSTNAHNKPTDPVDSVNLANKTITQKERKRLTYNTVSEIVKDSVYSTWVELKDSSASLALHFMYKDTLAVSYSSECWLDFPYKLDKNKIVVYWDINIDTKYDDFDIIKAIDKIDKKYIGKPFMILELVNDTTFKATYPLKDLIRKINSSSKDRTFFPDKYVIAQDGYI